MMRQLAEHVHADTITVAGRPMGVILRVNGVSQSTQIVLTAPEVERMAESLLKMVREVPA